MKSKESSDSRPEEEGFRRRIGAWVRAKPLRALLAAAGALTLLLLARWLVPDAVDTVKLERREVVETLVTTGRVRSVSRSGIGVSMPGIVTGVEAREGDRVAGGQLLLTLEDGEARASVEEARARLLGAEAALARVGSVDLPTATAALDAATMEADQLRRDVGRLRTIYEAGGLSLQEMEQAERAAEEAEARLANSRTRAASLGAGGPDRRAAEAEVTRAREALDMASARLDLTQLRAPAAGTVLIRRVEPGDAVQPGRILMEVALDGPTELLIFPDERSVAHLREGQAAIASADAFPDRQFPAAVSWIAPVVDPQQGTIEVRLRVPDPPAYLLADMTVSVNVEVDRRASALTLPLPTVRAPLTDTAWVLVARGGRAERIPVDVGIRDGHSIEVISGIDEDDVVIATTMEPGARVRPRSRGDS